ncbi:MAG: response regulator [Elusimicrobiota bacterium]
MAEKPRENTVLIVEDEEDIAVGVKQTLEAEGFSVDAIFDDFNRVIKYIKESTKKPKFVILDLDLGGNLSPDFLGVLYSKWKNTKVFIFTAYPEYLERYPYFKDIVADCFAKSEFKTLIKRLKES